jgi:hypothetical protein
MTAYATILLTVKADDTVWVENLVRDIGELVVENNHNLPYFNFAPDLSTLWEARDDTTEVTLLDFNGVPQLKADEVTVYPTRLGQTGGLQHLDEIIIETPHLSDYF